MLYDNLSVLSYLEKEGGKIVHLYGDPDTGRTSVMFSMIDYLISKGQMCSYLVPLSGGLQAERFRHYVKDISMCPLVIIKDRKDLANSLRYLTDAVENIFLDCFLSYILYRTKRQRESKTSPAYMEIFRRYSSKNILVHKDEQLNIYYDFKEW